MPPALLDDLHSPDLVITPRYVGPERRLAPRHHWDDSLLPGPTRSGGQRSHARRSLRWYQGVALVAVTVALVVPLTLFASHQASPATPTRPPATSLAAVNATRSARAQARQAAMALRQATQAARATAVAEQRAARSAGQAARLQVRTDNRLARQARQESRATARAARDNTRLSRVRARATASR